MPTFNLNARIGKLQELEARGVIKPEHATELDKYRQQGVAKGTRPGEPLKAKTTKTDETALQNASDLATAERDAVKDYIRASDAVGVLGDGRMSSNIRSLVLPEKDDGGMTAIAKSVLGWPVRALLDDKTTHAYEELNRVNAKAAVAASKDLKGPTSDRDIAMLRLSGISPFQSESSNRKVVRDAIEDSGMSTARAKTMQNWIGKFGSLTARAPNGMTFQDALEIAERTYTERYSAAQAKRTMPKAPPRSLRKEAQANRVRVDANGNIIQ
jgi:hypothetical protein